MEDRVDHVESRDLGHVGEFIVAGASRRGKSHAHMGTYRDDAFALTASPHGATPTWWMIAVSDGAGSCRLSRVGSAIATQTAVKHVEQHISGSCDLAKVVADSATAAVEALGREAARRVCPPTDLSCTLLLLVWVGRPRGEQVVTFQAGDGLIAAVSAGGKLLPLATADTESVAGATHFLTGEHVKKTWEARTRLALPEGDSPVGFIVATDGVSDDLVPYDRNGPILREELDKASNEADRGRALLELLGYEKRGSFDDRTLAFGWRRTESGRSCG